MQLDKMPTWTFESISVNGKGKNDFTYTYPNQKLYVMDPDMNTVNEAIAKIDAVEKEGASD